MTTDASLPRPDQPVTGVPPWQSSTTVPWAPPEPMVEPLPLPLASRALVAAIAAGLLAQLLFAFQMLGVNFPIWIAMVLAAGWRFRPRAVPFDRLDTWLPVSALIFAAFVGLRDDGMLLLFDVFAACALTLAAVVAFGGHAVTRGGWQRVTGLSARAVAVFWIGGSYIAPGAKPIAETAMNRRGERWRPLLRGLLIALPLVLVFAALFAAADAVFQSQLRNVINTDWIGPQAVFRTTLAVLAGWLFAGTLAAAWLTHRKEQPAAAEGVARTSALGTTEALVVLVALDAMFGIFAALQAAYLFGGIDTFTISGMTYSDYARRGFFELIIAAFLAGAVIVVMDRLVIDRSMRYRAAAAALAGLTGVIVLSAFVRLGLYQAAYGWTELRFYSLAAIAWLAVGVVITLAAVLFNRAQWVVQLVVGAGLVVAVVCNLIGPQAFVTDQNLQRALHPELVAAGGYAGLDADYLHDIGGADSIPPLVAARDSLTDPDLRQAVHSILIWKATGLREEAAAAGWPSWNLARQRALDALVAAGY